MASLETLIQSMYLAFIGGPGAALAGHTYDTFPDNADANPVAHVTTNTEGDYASIVTSIGSVDAWTVGLLVGGPTVPSVAGAVTEYVVKVTLSTGASGSETARIVVPYYQLGTTITVQAQNFLPSLYYSLPFPLHVPNGTQLWTRVKAVDTLTLTYSVVEHHAISVR